MLDEADEASLSWRTYNVTSFNPSAAEFLEELRKRFRTSDVRFCADGKRQAIVDSWPEDVNDDAARADWGWEPLYGLQSALDDYLVPAMKDRAPGNVA